MVRLLHLQTMECNPGKQKDSGTGRNALHGNPKGVPYVVNNEEASPIARSSISD